MKTHLITALTLFAVVTVSSEEETISIPLENQELGAGVILMQDNEGPYLRIEAQEGGNQSIHLFDIERPGITGEGYAIQGEVRHSGVTGESFLEMWSHLPAKAGGKEIAHSFFSRTMGVSGPMQKLKGDSDWRYFHLPGFVNDGSQRIPLKLTLNVVLPEKGIVEIRQFRLMPELPMSGQQANVGAKSRSLEAVVACTTVGIAIGAVLVIYLKKRQMKSELERIRTVDAVI